MKYKKELDKFKKFKNTYTFKELNLEEKDDKIYCEGLLIKDENGYIGESEKWINVGYNLKGTFPKLLSNLFPYKFKFKGYTINSLEAFFQGIKFPQKKLQKELFNYSGKEALVLKATSDYDWQKDGYIYFMGQRIKRDSKEYTDLIDELYISAIQNPFYRNAIKNCPLPILHIMGEVDKNKTVFTRYEFEYMLNALHEFLKIVDK